MFQGKNVDDRARFDNKSDIDVGFVLNYDEHFSSRESDPITDLLGQPLVYFCHLFITIIIYYFCINNKLFMTLNLVLILFKRVFVLLLALVIFL